jgi:hypothetical protein
MSGVYETCGNNKQRKCKGLLQCTGHIFEHVKCHDVFLHRYLKLQKPEIFHKITNNNKTQFKVINYFLVIFFNLLIPLWNISNEILDRNQICILYNILTFPVLLTLRTFWENSCELRKVCGLLLIAKHENKFQV